MQYVWERVAHSMALCARGSMCSWRCAQQSSHAAFADISNVVPLQPALQPTPRRTVSAPAVLDGTRAAHAPLAPSSASQLSCCLLTGSLRRSSQLVELARVTRASPSVLSTVAHRVRCATTK